MKIDNRNIEKLKTHNTSTELWVLTINYDV